MANQNAYKASYPDNNNQDGEVFNNSNDWIDPSELNRLLSLVGQNEPEAIETIMGIASQTSDNRTLHGSLQALGRLGTNEANQVLSNSIGKNLDNPVEVIRILSYFNRSVPLEDDIVDQLITYVDSPSATVETKRVIIKKVIKSSAYGRDMAEELMEKLDGF